MSSDLRVEVLVAASDPAWSGHLTERQMNDEFYLYTDIFLGVVKLSWFDGYDMHVMTSTGGPTGIFGTFAQFEKVFRPGSNVVLVDSYRGRELEVRRVDQDLVIRSRDRSSDVLRPTVSSAQAALKGALLNARSLVKAVYGARPYPDMIDRIEM